MSGSTWSLVPEFEVAARSGGDEPVVPLFRIEIPIEAVGERIEPFTSALAHWFVVWQQCCDAAAEPGEASDSEAPGSSESGGSGEPGAAGDEAMVHTGPGVIMWDIAETTRGPTLMLCGLSSDIRVERWMDGLIEEGWPVAEQAETWCSREQWESLIPIAGYQDGEAFLLAVVGKRQEPVVPVVFAVQPGLELMGLDASAAFSQLPWRLWSLGEA